MMTRVDAQRHDVSQCSCEHKLPGILRALGYHHHTCPVVQDRHRPPKPPSCEFCDQPAVAKCGWPVGKFVTVRYKNLKVGDRVRRAVDRLQRRAPAVVESVEPLFLSECRTMYWDLQVCLKIRGKTREIIVKPDSRVQVERPGICLAPVCENHLRRVEDGVEYCQTHWTSWAEVA